MWYNSKALEKRPVGQAAKTLASHAGNMGSIPVRVTKTKTHRKGDAFCVLVMGFGNRSPDEVEQTE